MVGAWHKTNPGIVVRAEDGMFLCIPCCLFLWICNLCNILPGFAAMGPTTLASVSAEVVDKAIFAWKLNLGTGKHMELQVEIKTALVSVFDKSLPKSFCSCFDTCFVDTSLIRISQVYVVRCFTLLLVRWPIRFQLKPPHERGLDWKTLASSSLRKGFTAEILSRCNKEWGPRLWF